jgi:lipopolysaccharide biosynthesis glycosyltransferase
MSVDYLPVMLSVAHPFPKLEQWVAERFEMLNGRKVRIIRREDLPPEALRSHAQYAKGWLWDVVPAGTERILYFDFDIVPLRPLPELPDDPFIAVPDGREYVAERTAEHPFFEGRSYFNSGFFVARSDTCHIFDMLKAFVKTKNPKDTRPFDQTKLNMLIQSSVGVTWLPRIYNTILLASTPEEGASAAMAHFCGLSRYARWVLLNVMRTTLGMRRLPEVKE